ncbi:NGG1p interacting factor 3 [Basidiobolus meristosporus CBS 931.73]|uniref:NGG1p interacting factor 3 n=1 Tax=Basidiobolus meristosporus CBS 931.73 TaxID=1314790 RepID=A0A1Y1YVS4_9FUNG|nr:NGG1p interacting factor 3 [Basidiobolus meristosporus CBS 931.73]|eukprot:ORY01944.1 NGG1p interacting factor 3 [Basidiobolus meristosporus CBS 931.73]
MSLLSRVIRRMERIAPLSLADTTWDNVGLLIEAPFPRQAANRIFLTIDLTTQVLEEAIKDEKVGVIIAYHPPIFRGMKRLNMSDVKQAIALKCAASGISVYSPHSALDSCEDGVNDWMSRALGEGSVKPITPLKEIPQDQPEAGVGRLFTLDQPASLSTLVERIKKHLNIEHVRVATSAKHCKQNDQYPQNIKTIAICAGSGSSVLFPAKADLYFTGEMSHHEVLACVEDNTSVVLCEHTNTERGYLSNVLKPRLEKLFSDEDIQVEIVVSQVDADPLKVM